MKDRAMNIEKPKVYLAGPTVFLEDFSERFIEMKRICSDFGFEGVAPIDNQVGLEGHESGKDLCMKIVLADRDLMDRLDGGIFCLDEVRRSTEMDPGTAVEIGYMYRAGKPLSGWVTDGRFYPEKVHEYFKGVGISKAFKNAQGGTSGTERDADGNLIHSAGCYVHGMAQGFIELSGGQIFPNPDWKVAFTQAARNVAELLHQERSLSLPKPTL
jgi:nucleoside 2-deoxyribosyltransferase